MSTSNPINGPTPNLTSAEALDRLYDLLATRAVEGLSAPETTELESLLRQHPQVDPSSFDLTAAAMMFEPGSAPKPVALPAALADRIAQAAASELAELSRAANGSDRPAAPSRDSFPIAEARASSQGRLILPWLAAAAALALAAVSWWPRLFPAHVPTVAELRQALIAQAPDAKTLPWAPQADPTAKGMTGDIVWSDSLNRGYIRFTGLAANDPKANQYQLWIFDAKGADANYPVDGGVFDIPAGVAEAIIPIDAKIRVGQAAVFAVTVERPGGVVVTTKERLVALAKP